MKKILFICQANVGRSQMAEAYYNHFTQSQDATSAGLIDLREKYQGHPAPEIIQTMQIDKIDISRQTIKLLSPEIVQTAKRIVVLCVKDECPAYLQQAENTLFYEIEDPYKKGSKAIDHIREQVKILVRQLITHKENSELLR